MAEFASDVIFQIGSFPVTNTIINTLLVDGLLIGGTFYLKKHINKVPGVFQNIMEIVIETFYDLNETIAGSERTKKIFPYFMTFFLFILVANWTGLIPGISTFGFWEGIGAQRHLVPFLRNTTSDLNTTLGLALISLVATHVLAIRSTGFREYISRFISLNPVYLYVGILELVGEFTKIISLSFRLFGNIFAGEVVLGKIGDIFAFFAPIPFVMLEIIVGLVQALVFAMLTMVFMSVLMTPHHEVSHDTKGVTS